MKIKKTKPMSIHKINKILNTINGNYSLKKENNEIIMINNTISKRQVQPNLLKHLAK